MSVHHPFSHASGFDLILLQRIVALRELHCLPINAYGYVGCFWLLIVVCTFVLADLHSVFLGIHLGGDDEDTLI